MKIRKLLTSLFVVFMVFANTLSVSAIEDDDFYGVVVFDDEVNYTSIYNGKTSFNSSFGVDAAYLFEEDDKVYFKISGDIGYIDKDEVDVISLQDLDNRISAYYVKNNVLFHNIKTSINHDFFTYSLPIDDAPEYLNNDSIYYSYDGKYFYTSFTSMIDDYRQDVNERAINFENPYYNYYEFLPARSYTNLSLDDLKEYFYNFLMFKAKLNSYSDLSKDGANDVVNRSQIYGELESFLTYEELYGVNALRLLAEAINESSYGKSYDSYMKNNLYTSAAYDSNLERELNRYLDIDTSIYAHAKYFISRAYANNKYDFYKGSALGNKASGTSAYLNDDIYNGEKVASYYYQIDSKLGYKDKNEYAIGIIEDLDNLNIFKDENLEDNVLSLKNLKDYSLILLEENEDSYKVQLDPCFNLEYFYDPEVSVGYLDKDDIDYIVGNKEIKEPKYEEIKYLFGEGDLHGLDEVSFKLKDGKEPIMIAPKLNGYDLKQFKLDKNSDSKIYIADYDEIRKVEIHNKVKEKNEYGSPINMEGGSIKVTYDTFTSKVIEYNTNIVSGIKDNKFQINYSGFTLGQNANVSYDLITSKEEIETIIEENINSFVSDGTYDINELKKAKESIKNLGYELSVDEIRTLDEIFLDNSRNDVNYSFERFDHDISVSGLALAMREPGILNIFKPFKDTYFTRIGNVSSTNETIANGVAKAYGFEEVLPLKLSIQFNLRTAMLEAPIIVSVKIEDKKDYSIYSVYHVDEDGDVTKCLTTQSDDYISFITKENGDYFVYRKDSFNDYDFANHYENINIYNADADNHLLFINGSMLFAMGIIGSAIIVVHIMLNRKQEKLWKDYKKYWQPAASPQEEKPKS